MQDVLKIMVVTLLISGMPSLCLSGTTGNQSWPQVVTASMNRLIESGIAEKELESLTQSLIQAGFTDQEIITLHRALQQAFHNGVPMSAATDKAREGVAKRVPAAMINLALERQTNRYRHSMALASQFAGGDDRQAGRLTQTIAASNTAGLSFEEIESLLQTVATSNNKVDHELVAEILSVARDLARQSVPPKTVSDIMGLAVAKGFSVDNLRDLNKAFAAQSLQYPVATVATRCLSSMQTRDTPTAILENFTAVNGNGGPRGKGLGRQNRGNSRGSGQGSGQGGGHGGGNGNGGGGNGR